MKIRFHRSFEKQYKKLRVNEREKTKKRLVLFIQDEFNPALNNHPLRGKYKGYRSINVTGDFRAIYKRASSDMCIFIAVDTHSNLYD